MDKTSKIKPRVLGIVLIPLLLLMTGSIANAQNRSVYLQSFSDMIAKGGQAQKILSRGVSARGAFVECDIQIDGETYQSGAKIWFELKDGRYVHPLKHKWSINERFFIWVESPVPAFFYMSQNYPEDRPPTKEIFPDQRYPKTFYPFPAGRPYRLPVQFKMDDDQRNEIISICLVRVDDTETLPPNWRDGYDDPYGLSSSVNTGGSSLQETGGAARSVPRGGAAVARALSKKNAEIERMTPQQKKNSPKARVSISGGDRESSQNPDDVAVIVFGVGKVTQVQFTLIK